MRVDEKALRELCEKIFFKLGVKGEDANTVTDVLVEADLRGISSHGVARLKRYVDGIRCGKMNPKPKMKVVRENPVMALIDADNALGQVAGVFGMKKAIEKAKDMGVGIVSVAHSNHYGIAGYYSMMALKYDFIGISMTNSAPLVIPTFGSEPILGTNPLSIAIPTGSQAPVVLDMATSVVTRGKIEVYARMDRKLPEGWAVGEEGEIETNPSILLKGFLERKGGILPLGGEGETFGGHKGYGLSFIIDILAGVLSGSAFGKHTYESRYPDLGHFFCAVDISCFRDASEFKRDMDRYIQEIKSSKKASEEKRIYVHGEKEFENKERNQREGIPLDEKTLQMIKKLSQEVLGSSPDLNIRSNDQ